MMTEKQKKEYENLKLTVKLGRSGGSSLICEPNLGTIMDIIDEQSAQIESLIAGQETLQAECKRMEAERDAAVFEIERSCQTCALSSKNNKSGKMCSWWDDCNQIEGEHWEWRGIQNGKDGEPK